MPPKGRRTRRPAAESTPTGSRPCRPSASSTPTASQRSRTESIPGHSVLAEMVYEIFLRLPVETLKQLRFACKAWYSLISSLNFRRDHFLRGHQSNALRLLTLQEKGSSLHISTYNARNGDPVAKFSRKIDLSYFTRSWHATPYSQSCRGLVCIASWSPDNPPILVCNPATEEFIELPSTLGLVLCVGFGYADSTEEFKVVRISFRKKTIFEVFTLGSRQWRELRNPPPYNVRLGRAPFLHGALHFLPQNYGGSVNETDHHVAVFDLGTEEFGAIRLPDFYYSLSPNVLSASYCLSILGESLCFTCNYMARLAKLEMWILKGYENAEWVKGYTIDVSSVYSCPTTTTSFWAYPSDSTGDEITLNYTENNEHKLLSFNPQTGVVTVSNETEWAATLYEESFCPM